MIGRGPNLEGEGRQFSSKMDSKYASTHIIHGRGEQCGVERMVGVQIDQVPADNCVAMSTTNRDGVDARQTSGTLRSIIVIEFVVKDGCCSVKIQGGLLVRSGQGDHQRRGGQEGLKLALSEQRFDEKTSL